MTELTTPKTAGENATGTMTLPVLTLRDIVVLPNGVVVPLRVGRQKSINALNEAMEKDKSILLVTQKDSGAEDPDPDGLYRVGTVGSVSRLVTLSDGVVMIVVKGMHRLHILDVDNSDDAVLRATGEIVPDEYGDEEELAALMRGVRSQFEQYLRINRNAQVEKIQSEIMSSLAQMSDPSEVADTIATHLSLKITEKQELLEQRIVNERLEKILGFLEGEIGVLQVERKIRTRVKKQMEKTQREYYLNEQIKAIQKELGENEEGVNDIDEIQKKIDASKMSKEAREKANAEVKKLRNMSPMSAESTVLRNYLDWLTALPWDEKTSVTKNLREAQKILDNDHYGLDKVKERIVEYLAVQQRQSKLKGPILCLVGPPGVGKTSLGKSIAQATGRNFVRMSLGGVRDEAEIRGHRRTYIGSMPGKIIQGMKKAKSANPLFLLDEVDKLGSDWRGDPSSALLEVLDPEQNQSFNDHYMEVDYDLSDVMFVCTANTLRMPQPLLDRMEIIRLSGYTEDEKVAIAQHHLVPKIVQDHGLKKREFSISEDALRDIIRYYTREAGVRNLERELARIARKSVRQILVKESKSVAISRRNLGKYLGVRKFRFGEVEESDLIGVTTGLAWTEVGGELLSIESLILPGKGKVTITGKLGDVMRESVQAAESYVKARAAAFGIKRARIDKRDIHVHVPEGATPKDGPSAGVAMATSIVSVLTDIPVHRDVAMTGEITLRGRVLPIGGLKEKLLAALRGGIKTVLIPKDNEKDLAEIPETVKKGLKIIAVSSVDEVLRIALTAPLVPIEWEEEKEKTTALPSDVASPIRVPETVIDVCH